MTELTNRKREELYYTLTGYPPERDQTCERVSVPVPCETCTLQHRYVERCAYHGCAWPDEGECPAAELEDLAALGDGRDEYGSVQP